MSRQIYVLDTETTGLGGYAAGDKVLEIGIARLDLDRGKVFPEYSRIIREPLTPEQEHSWVFENTDLTPEDVASSPHTAQQVAWELVSMYHEKKTPFTAYNVDFDFCKFLKNPPYYFRPRMAPCIMETAADRYNDGMWFTAQAAYNMLCKDNPAGVPEGREQHKALSDAIVEAWILQRMCESNPDILGLYVEACDRCGGGADE